MPTVSVIMPCYNGAKTIAESIDSVIAQTYENWELIIVNDFSSDNSLDIIKDYNLKDQRIRFFNTDKPSGSPSQPRNIAMSKASGRYIAFLDSDDIWHPTKIEKQLEIVQKYKTPFVFSNYEKMTSEGAISDRIVISPSRVTLKDMYYGNPMGCLTVMIDIETIGKFAFKKNGHEDCVAWIEILQKGYIAHNTNTIEAVYRESKNSVSSNKFVILHWQWNIYRKILKLGVLKSIYYYLHYAVRGFLKSRI